MTAIRRTGSNPIRDDIELIVATAKDRLTGQPVSAMREWLAGNVFNDLRDSNDYDDLERKTQFLIDDLDACRIVLQGVLSEAIDAENIYVSRERFGEAWRKRRQREIKEAFRKGPEEGRGRWLATYMEALAASRFDVCHQMTLEDWLRPAQCGRVAGLAGSRRLDHAQDRGSRLGRGPLPGGGRKP